MKTLILFILTGLFLTDPNDFEIHFQGGFDINDSCSLSINGCKIFENKTFNGFVGLDFTGCVIHSHTDSGYHVINDIGKTDTIRCEKSDVFVIKFKVNRIENEFKIDRVKGTYLGFSKNEDGTIHLTQYTSPFIYE